MLVKVPWSKSSTKYTYYSIFYYYEQFTLTGASGSTRTGSGAHINSRPPPCLSLHLRVSIYYGVARRLRLLLQ
jgi:hypothetical protein